MAAFSIRLGRVQIRCMRLPEPVPQTSPRERIGDGGITRRDVHGCSSLGISSESVFTLRDLAGTERARQTGRGSLGCSRRRFGVARSARGEAVICADRDCRAGSLVSVQHVLLQRVVASFGRGESGELESSVPPFRSVENNNRLSPDNGDGTEDRTFSSIVHSAFPSSVFHRKLEIGTHEVPAVYFPRLLHLL